MVDEIKNTAAIDHEIKSEAIGYIETAIERMEEITPSREASLTKTKLQEALHWLDEVTTIAGSVDEVLG